MTCPLLPSLTDPAPCYLPLTDLPSLLPSPLCAPQGGRYNDLILREDQLLAKAHRLRAKKKDKAELDPFAPEYGEDTWHQVGFQCGALAAQFCSCGQCTWLGLSQEGRS